MGDWVGRTLVEGRAPVNNGRASAGSPWELCEDLPGEKIRTRDVGKDGRRVDAWMYLAGDWLTVILTLDADDALAGRHVLDRVRAEYDDGAELTIGSMLRLGKEASYPADFREPRSWNGNVWQHLRTFRKYLFDAMDVEDLKLDGEWIDLANDWAFMVPMVEMASSSRLIPEPLYIYEPAEAKRRDDTRQRNAVIARILPKPLYAKL